MFDAMFGEQVRQVRKGDPMRNSKGLLKKHRLPTPKQPSSPVGDLLHPAFPGPGSLTEGTERHHWRGDPSLGYHNPEPHKAEAQEAWDREHYHDPVIIPENRHGVGAVPLAGVPRAAANTSVFNLWDKWQQQRGQHGNLGVGGEADYTAFANEMGVGQDALRKLRRYHAPHLEAARYAGGYPGPNPEPWRAKGLSRGTFGENLDALPHEQQEAVYREHPFLAPPGHPARDKYRRGAYRWAGADWEPEEYTPEFPHGAHDFDPDNPNQIFAPQRGHGWEHASGPSGEPYVRPQLLEKGMSGKHPRGRHEAWRRMGKPRKPPMGMPEDEGWNDSWLVPPQAMPKGGPPDWTWGDEFGETVGRSNKAVWKQNPYGLIDDPAGGGGRVRNDDPNRTEGVYFPPKYVKNPKLVAWEKQQRQEKANELQNALNDPDNPIANMEKVYDYNTHGPVEFGDTITVRKTPTSRKPYWDKHTGQVTHVREDGSGIMWGGTYGKTKVQFKPDEIMHVPMPRPGSTRDYGHPKKQARRRRAAPRSPRRWTDDDRATYLSEGPGDYSAPGHNKPQIGPERPGDFWDDKERSQFYRRFPEYRRGERVAADWDDVDWDVPREHWKKRYDPNNLAQQYADKYRRERQRKQGRRKQAWSGWGPAQFPKIRQVPNWKWDKYLNGYLANANHHFACDCGEAFPTPTGFRVCGSCGKQWNSYVIGTGGSAREAAAEKFLVREIPLRKEGDVIVASRQGNVWERNEATNKEYDAYYQGTHPKWELKGPMNPVTGDWFAPEDVKNPDDWEQTPGAWKKRRSSRRRTGGGATPDLTGDRGGGGSGYGGGSAGGAQATTGGAAPGGGAAAAAAPADPASPVSGAHGIGGVLEAGGIGSFLNKLNPFHHGGIQLIDPRTGAIHNLLDLGELGDGEDDGRPTFKKQPRDWARRGDGARFVMGPAPR